MITIDLEKAKVIFKQKIREKRTPILEKLDLEYMRATEESNTKKKKEIVEKKELLRNLTDTPEIESATTLDALSNSWNTELLGPRPW